MAPEAFASGDLVVNVADYVAAMKAGWDEPLADE
jgi:hypothetical protein